METIREIAAAIWSYDGVRFIAVGVLLNVVLAVALAARDGTISARVIGEFLHKQLLPYVLTYYVFRLASDGTGFEWVASAVWGLIVTMISAAILDKLHQLGVPLPDTIAHVVRRPPTHVYIKRVDE